MHAGWSVKMYDSLQKAAQISVLLAGHGEDCATLHGKPGTNQGLSGHSNRYRGLYLPYR